MTSRTINSSSADRLSGRADGEVLYASTAATTVGLSIVALLVVGQLYAVLPMLDAMVDEWRVATSVVAWLTTAFGLAYAAGMLVAGPLSDRYGRRRVVVIGLIGLALATGGVALAGSFAGIVALRVVQGFAAGFFTPTALAYLGERLRPEVRNLALSAVISACLAAAVLAPMGAQVVTVEFGWRSWFVISAVTLLAAAGWMAWLLLPGVSDSATAGLLAVFRPLPGLLVSRRLRWLYLATATVMTGFVGVSAALQLAGPGGLNDHPGRLLMVRALTLPACVIMPVLAVRLGRYRALRRVLVGLVISAVATVVMAVGPGPVGVTISLFVLTAAATVMAPGLIESISERAGQARGAAIALYGCILFLGASVGPQLAVAATPHGFGAAGFVLAGVFLLGIGATLLSARNRP